MLQVGNSFASWDNIAVIDGEQHMVNTCKTILLPTSLGVQVIQINAGCSAVQFYNPTKLVIWLIIKNSDPVYMDW